MILLCVDVSEEVGEPWHDVSGPTKLGAIKEVLSTLVRTKLAINPRHEFGVCLLADEATLALPFTNDGDIVRATLDSLSVVPCTSGFEFHSLFELLEQHVDLDAWPDSLVRVVLVYGRSHAVPTLSAAPALLEHPRFFLDALYIHKKMSAPGVVCQDVYDFFMQNFESDVDHAAGPAPHKTAYFFEVATSVTRLQQHVMMLLAHAGQRDDQDSFLEKLEFCVPEA